MNNNPKATYIKYDGTNRPKHANNNKTDKLFKTEKIICITN